MDRELWSKFLELVSIRDEINADIWSTFNTADEDLRARMARHIFSPKSDPGFIEATA